jgi:aryl-alcohol dehydrogenase-like predicted oxidoreductase
MADRKITRRDFVKESALAAGGLALGASALRAADTDTKKILNYNPDMEYRRCGKMGLMISAVAMGGHWKRIENALPPGSGGNAIFGANLGNADFQKNRRDVLTRCMERGINWIDACTCDEVKAYTKAVEGRRDKMYMGCSWYEREMRNGQFRTKKALLETLDWGMKDAGLEYVDLWRITMHEQSIQHTDPEVEQMMMALEAAKKSGKVRFGGFSSHHREHIRGMIEKYPTIIDGFSTPYTAKTKELPKESLFDTVRKYEVAVFGIKPFSSNSLFKGDSSLKSPDAEEDDKRARLAIRYILCNPAIQAPIPGLINTHQVDNVADAVKERRQLDQAEKAQLDKAMDEAWAKLDEHHQFLKDWEYV